MGLFSKRQPKECTKAPIGWQCSREGGHEGPCAAHPTQGNDFDAVTEEALDALRPLVYHDRFEEICADMIALHNQKGADYGSGTDPYANVRASEEFGVPPWIGALIRMNDKITRLKSFIRQGRLVNESAFDSIRDIAVYAIIMRILYEEQDGGGTLGTEITREDIERTLTRLEGGVKPEAPFPDFNPPADPDPDHSNEQEHVPEPAAMLDQVPQVEPLTTPDPSASCWCDMEPVKPHEPHLAAINYDTELTFDKDQNPVTQKYVINEDGGREWI